MLLLRYCAELNVQVRALNILLSIQLLQLHSSSIAVAFTTYCYYCCYCCHCLRSWCERKRQVVTESQEQRVVVYSRLLASIGNVIAGHYLFQQ
jgi:hypothetical protein